LRKIPVNGWLYDGLLEPLLKKIKKRVADFVFDYSLFPALDICCGTGVQCRMISQKHPEVAGLDIDLDSICYAKSKYPSIPFVCADAAQIPFKNSSFRGVVISYALHDKFPQVRSLLIKEVRRIIVPEGKVVFVDFENPWSRKSKIANLYVYGIERMAGRTHFRNGRQFLEQGGLKAFFERNGLEEIDRHDVESAHTGIVVAQFSK
jgi:ubiquinone/menaquinone biosynthesis C-methylase UbiE